MNDSDSLDSNALRQRIASLEEDLRDAQAAKIEAESQAHKKSQRAHHVRPILFLFVDQRSFGTRTKSRLPATSQRSGTQTQ
jgi:hypothetical protein